VRIADFALPTFGEASHHARVRDALVVLCPGAAEASNIILDEGNGDGFGVEDVPSLSPSERDCWIFDMVLAPAGLWFG
jgi:hypothetical protein